LSRSSKVTIILVPLVLSLGIISLIPHSFGEELICPSGEIEIVRVTNPESICIDQDTAQRWNQLGIAKIVGEIMVIASEEEKPHEEFVPEITDLPEEIISTFQYGQLPDDASRAQYYLVTISGGDLVDPITFQTFSKVEPGDKPHYISSFHDLGLDTYFSLESIPSSDKIEFYNIVAKTINYLM
jgi:hypothetical protein